MSRDAAPPTKPPRRGKQSRRGGLKAGSKPTPPRHCNPACQPGRDVVHVAERHAADLAEADHRHDCRYAGPASGQPDPTTAFKAAVPSLHYSASPTSNSLEGCSTNATPSPLASRVNPGLIPRSSASMPQDRGRGHRGGLAGVRLADATAGQWCKSRVDGNRPAH